ncbi:MAG: FAD-dependent oxidoreductase [Clostridia bacterium]|nr:FAD-dependent oxidoreductase [Clostridia bacterium]
MPLYDVIVCGCGSAGFCAAIAAARNGMKTAIVEKYATPGGILTVLGNNSIDQFNNPFRKKG